MPIIQINTSKILVLSRNIPDVQGAALLLLLLQFCLLKLIIKGLTPWTPEVPQWHSAFEQCEKVSRRNRLTDLRCGDGMWGCVCVWLYDVQVCVEYLSSERVHSCVYVSGGTVKWLCGVRQIFVWLSAITSTAACFSCSISASRIDATVCALH